MRIQNNVLAINAHRQLAMNNTAMGKNVEKLSSGYAINRAADDAAGLAISEKMRFQIKNLEAAEDNAYDAISAIQTAEGALTEVHSMLNRMTELVTRGTTGTMNTDDINASQVEIDALLAEIDNIAKTTKFNDKNLLTGTAEQDDSMGSPMTIMLADGETMKITAKAFKNLGTVQLGVNGLSVSDIGSLNIVRAAITMVSQARAELGAFQNRLEHSINNMGATRENIVSAESRIRDTDMASEMMEYTGNNVLIQAAQSMLAQANQQPQGVLQLLG